MAMIQCRECGGNISSEALTCPHCGCPQKKAETQYYELEKAQETDCYGARFLRTLAYILWIGGLILAIATSIGTETSRYGRTTTTFLWSNFVNVLSNYAIYGCAAWSVSLLFADIHGINVALNSLKLVQKVQRENQPSTRVYAQSSRWKCPRCGTQNENGKLFCVDCGEIKP